MPASAFAVDYLSAEQAQKLLFPGAVSFFEKSYSLSTEQLQSIAKLGRINARSSAWKITQAIDASGKVLGAFVIDNVIGKYELITYAVAIDTTGAIKGIEILSYRESHGGEIRMPAWRKQFVGKTAKDDLQVGSDIALISGATLSSKNVTDGVRRISAILDTIGDQWKKPST